MAKKPTSECVGKPRASSGCGQGGYMFTTKKCKPESKPVESIIESDSNPKLSDIPCINFLAIALIFSLYSKAASLHKTRRINFVYYFRVFVSANARRGHSVYTKKKS